MSSRIVEPAAQQPQQVEAQESVPSRSKLVQRLLDASQNIQTFLKDLLTTQAVLVAGTEAAAFLVERQANGMALRVISHIRPDESDAETRSAAIRAFQNIIQPCVEQRKDGAIEVGSPDGGDSQFCLVTVLRNEGEVVAASAVITRARDMERAKQRLTSMQLVAGYFELFSLRRYNEQARALAERHQHVLQYAGAVGMAEGFVAAAMGLCNELATRTGASRVALGWMKGRYIKVRALSHTEKFDKKQELVVDLQRTMEECVDQEEPVRFDPGGNSSPNVTRSARELSRRHGGNIVLTVPLRHREEIAGALTLEFPPRQDFDPGVEAGMAVAAELLAPQLYDRYENDRFIFVKIGRSIQNNFRLVTGPKHLGKTLLVLLVVASLASFLTFYHPTYRVRAPFQLTALDRRSMTAPFDGFIEHVYIRPGQPATENQVLARMKTTELELDRTKAEAQMLSKLHQAEAYRDEGRNAEARIAEFEAQEARKQMELLDYMISQASITAPFDGVVLQGDLFDRVGMPVRQGDVLFEISRADPENPGRIAVEMEALVSERDIQEVKRVWEQQQQGVLSREYDAEISTSSFPDRDNRVKITRIVPLGLARDGENVFQVYGEVLDPAEWMHPGLAGEVRVNIEPRNVTWIWTHRLIDWLKLKLWI